MSLGSVKLPLEYIPGAGAGGASLRRRNSDPARGAAPDARPADPRSAGFIGQAENGLFRIAGHR